MSSLRAVLRRHRLVTIVIGAALGVILTIAILSLLNRFTLGASLEDFAQWVERLAPFFQILASLGVLGGLITAFLGFRRYLTEKEREHVQRDTEYLSALRKSIYISRPIFTELNRLLKYELFYEMALCVSNFKPIDVVLAKGYDLRQEVAKYDNSSVGADYSYASLYMSLYFAPDVGESLQRALDNKLQSASFPEEPYRQPSEQAQKVYLGIPVHTKLVELFESYTKTIGREIEPYRFDYPSLSRVLLSANHFFASLGEDYKLHARDTDRWVKQIANAASVYRFASSPEQIFPIVQNSSEEPSPEEPSPEEPSQNPPSSAVPDIVQNYTGPESQGSPAEMREQIKQDIQQKVETIQSRDEFKDRVTQDVVNHWYIFNFSQDAEAIDAILGIVQIVTRTYLSKTDEDLLEIREQERKMKFAPLEQTPRPEQLLQEAYNGLKPVLSEYDRDSYHALAQTIARSSAQKIAKNSS